MSRTKPEGCPAFLPSNLCFLNQKTCALQVSCHIPVFPQALMGNGRMEWQEIYGTNPSRVLKTLASICCCSLHPPSPPALLLAANQNLSRQIWTSQSGVAPKAERHLAFGPSCSLMETMRTWTPLTPGGGFKHFSHILELI